jgi:hypothetical protein
MIYIKDLTEEQKEFLHGLVVDTHFEPFTQNQRIQIVKEEFEEHFKQDFKFDFDDFEEFFETLDLRHCENCGLVEEFDNGGGTINEMVCCGECYNQIANELEEDEE